MRTRLSYAVLIAGILCLVVSGYLLDRAYKRTSYANYTLRVEYQVLPGDDGAIETWLSQHSGVSKATVSRVGNTVSFDITLNHPSPDLLAAVMRQCEASGYKGRLGYIGGFGPYR